MFSEVALYEAFLTLQSFVVHSTLAISYTVAGSCQVLLLTAFPT